jgi:hypothetical protein
MRLRLLWLSLPLLALPALFPLLTTGLTASADGATHLMRTALLVNHWQHGALYPRWIPELVTGLGYSVFNYYAPGAYYLTGAIQLSGATLAHSTVLVFILFVVAGGLGMYLLARDLFGTDNPWPALLAGVAYMYAPYLLANVYVRGAIAEVGAQALLPWVLWCGRRLLTTNRPAAWIAPFALSLGALAVTHTITLIIFPPFLLGYLVAVWRQHGHRPTKLGWVVAAIVAAMGISAFFWIPLIGESNYLRQDAFGISIEIFVPENLWRWQEFLDFRLVYEYTFDVPYQLGLVQITLAVVGLFFVRRWNPEWLYLLLATLFTCFAIGAWTEPIWLNNRLLLAVQFPWRLLAIVSLTLPLFTSALVWRISDPRRQAFATLVLTLVVIAANMPRVGWMGTLETENGAMPLPAIARHESITGQLGTGPTREFMPKWNEGDVTYLPESPQFAMTDADISLRRADAYGLELNIVSSSGGPLRFTNFYFPGWQATLDNATPLEPYPDTNLGLLAVDLPPGDATLHLANPGTELQHWATWLTLATLAALVVLLWRVRGYWLLGVFALLLLVGGGAQMQTPEPTHVQPPERPLHTDELTLLGYRIQQDGAARLLIYPTWYVHKTPQPDLRVGWELRDRAGNMVNLTATLPYFNSQRASNWPPGAIVDDAYELLLPPGTPAGAYQLAVQLYSPDMHLETAPILIGTVELQAAPEIDESVAPNNQVSLRFGDAIRLVGYDLHISQQEDSSTDVTIVHPGDALEYTLFWAADAPPAEDYHGFVHLVDAQGNAIAQMDHLPGSIFHPPMTWDIAHIRPDTYTVRVPENTPNGLLWPTVGLYSFDTKQRLSAVDETGQPIGEAFRLPPVKVYGENLSVAPQHVANVTLGEDIMLLGYDLVLPGSAVQPGDQFTLTLYYQGRSAIDTDLTQFIHLFDPVLGMVAQHDSPPLRGANPTYTWQPGEIVVDQIPLQVSSDAIPGLYTLGVGMYNPLDGIRVPATDAEGKTLHNAIVTLFVLHVEQAEN